MKYQPNEYDFSETNTVITVKRNYKPNSQENIKYTFDNKTNNLLKVTSKNRTPYLSEYESVFEYFYMTDSNLHIVNRIKRNGEEVETNNIVSFTKDTINYIDTKNKKLYFSQDYSVNNKVNGTLIFRLEGLSRETFIFFNNKLNNPQAFIYPISTVQQNSELAAGTISFDENFIYYGNVNNKTSVLPAERRGLLLFDDNKNLIERHFYDEGFFSRAGGDGIDQWNHNSKNWNYKVMVKESNEQWNLSHFGEREREIEFDENSAMIYKKTDSASFQKKKNALYYKNRLILKYK